MRQGEQKIVIFKQSILSRSFQNLNAILNPLYTILIIGTNLILIAQFWITYWWFGFCTSIIGTRSRGLLKEGEG